MNKPIHVKRALKHLGEDYSTKIIDMELCCHRKLGEKYDVEISHTRKDLGNGSGYRAFLWEIQDRPRIVDRMPRYTKDLDELKAWLDEKTQQYIQDREALA